MATVIRINTFHESDEPDSLGRTRFGYYPGITEKAAFEAGRGVWKLGLAADGQRFALIVGGGRGKGTVLAVAEIESLEVDKVDPSRRYIEGSVLTAGHPVRDAYIGKQDPSGSASQNPIAYADLPEEKEYLERTCACGCGTATKRDFAPGHDHKAIHERIKAHFGGSTLQFLEWFDRTAPQRSV